MKSDHRETILLSELLMTRLESGGPAGETASSKSPRWEHKLEVVKPQQEAQGVRGRERGHRLEK